MTGLTGCMIRLKSRKSAAENLPQKICRRKSAAENLPQKICYRESVAENLLPVAGEKKMAVQMEKLTGEIWLEGQYMAEDLFQNTRKNERSDSGEKRRRNKKRGNRIIGIAALGLLLAACGASAERAQEMQSAEAKEEPKEWPQEHGSCQVQELSGYLYEHTSVSPCASAEITIKDYEGEKLETRWEEPSAFRFAGEADVTWRFYSSPVEMEAALNEAAMQEMDGNALHFLYYTFPMTEDDHALDLYHILKKKFDGEEHPLTAWSADNGKLF